MPVGTVSSVGARTATRYVVSLGQYRKIMRMVRATVKRGTATLDTGYTMEWCDERGRFTGRYHYFSAYNDVHSRVIAEFRKDHGEYTVTVRTGNNSTTAYLSYIVGYIVRMISKD